MYPQINESLQQHNQQQVQQHNNQILRQRHNSNLGLCLELEDMQQQTTRGSPPNNRNIQQSQERIYGQKGPGAPKGSKSQNKKNSVGGFVGLFNYFKKQIIF